MITLKQKLKDLQDFSIRRCHRDYNSIFGSIYYVCLNNGAVTCDFQQCGILTSVDSDGHVKPPFKLRNSKLCLVSSITLIQYSSD